MRQIKIVYIIFIVLLSSVLYVNAGIDGKCGNNIACVCGERLNATRTLTSSDTLTNCNNLTVLTIEAEHISLDCAKQYPNYYTLEHTRVLFFLPC